MKLLFYQQIFEKKKPEISNTMKIRPGLSMRTDVNTDMANVYFEHPVASHVW